jgi:hypothetical protein
MYSTDTTTNNAISNYNQYGSSGNRIVIRIDNNIASTKAELNAYFSNNDTYAIYEAVEPTDLPCTAEQTAILENLPYTYDDETNIYSVNTVIPYMEIQYYEKEGEQNA